MIPAVAFSAIQFVLLKATCSTLYLREVIKSFLYIKRNCDGHKKKKMLQLKPGKLLVILNLYITGKDVHARIP